jgi:hypothetical protein
MDGYEPPERVYGVDFSADRERAGEKIWIAEAVVEDGLRVVSSEPLVEFLGVERQREVAIPALTEWLAGLEGVAVGLDFPFSLPDEVIAAEEWPEFLRRLPGWADDPSDLARECEARAELEGDASEVLRETEEPLGALCPYNRRLRAQTFYGQRDVLRPLVLADAARAAPMQAPVAGRPTLLEVYPAGTFDRLGAHDLNYKGEGDDAREHRDANLAALADAGIVVEEAAQERALDDEDGDALDAVTAAVAAHQHARDPADLHTDDGVRRIEGHIYV